MILPTFFFSPPPLFFFFTAICREVPPLHFIFIWFVVLILYDTEVSIADIILGLKVKMCREQMAFKKKNPLSPVFSADASEIREAECRCDI